MQNIQEYLSQLSKRDRILLVISLSLLSFIVVKFFIIDSLNESNTKLLKKSTLISQQEAVISNFDGNSVNSLSSNQSSNQLVNKFLKQSSASKSLKQIRKTNDGSQRFELEDIKFDTIVQLINFLDENAVNYTGLQIKKTKNSGLVDAKITIQ